ncbi:MAG: bifunctional folylpolyglutamate synthase/dihydrofolate synthase [Blautia sp.]|nr:bifunctional folylpolyglutamate synthase/dihydrofolate synthase [Blautia sp.]
MDYSQSRKYVEDALRFGSVLGLDTMRELMSRLGNPQDNLRFVHVAGTNGKGSVIAYLFSVLTKAGYRVGRYVSPALYSYREKWAVSGKDISREDFARVMTLIRPAVESMVAAGCHHPTSFEIETAAAFVYFSMEKCDLVLLETGMGGDLDATNIVRNTLLVILTAIGMDHMEFLGNTLGEIAQKKAGIIKEGSVVLSVRQEKEAMEVIKKACFLKKDQLMVCQASEAGMVRDDLEGVTFCWEGEEYHTPLPGLCQLENAVAALHALALLEKQGYPTTIEERRKGLSETVWRGRFSVLGRNPLFIVDGAHNPPAAKRMEENLQRYLRGRRLFFIMGVFKDKDYHEVLRITAPYASMILTIQTPDNPRALPASELALAVEQLGIRALPFEQMEDALKTAFSLAGPEDAIVAFGSLSFISELTGLYQIYAADSGMILQ